MEDSDYSGAMAPVYASAAAELVRLLKQATREADGIHDAVDASVVLWNVAQLLHDLPLALRQVGTWLDTEAAQARVSVDCGPYAQHPNEAVGVVNAYLVATCSVLEEAATGLSAAQTIAETLTTPGAGMIGEEGSAMSTDVDTPGHRPDVGASVLQFPPRRPVRLRRRPQMKPGAAG